MKPLTPIQVERIIELVKAGAYVSVIEKRLGMRRDQLWDRIHAGEKESASEADADFAMEFRCAEAECEIALVGYLQVAAASDPDFALKLLERRFPKRWAGRSEGERETEPVRVKEGIPISKAKDVAKGARLRLAPGGRK
jgi:hypothetical protein